MEYSISDGLMHRIYRPNGDHSRNISLVHNWLESHDGKAFVASITKPGDHISVSIRPRVAEDPVNYDETPWAKMLQNPAVHDPSTRLGKCFRLRFRVPYPLFLLLFEYAGTFNMFDVC